MGKHTADGRQWGVDDTKAQQHRAQAIPHPIRVLEHEQDREVQADGPTDDPSRACVAFLCPTNEQSEGIVEQDRDDHQGRSDGLAPPIEEQARHQQERIASALRQERMQRQQQR